MRKLKNKKEFDAIHANIYSDDLIDNIELSDVGYMMALTGNTSVNKKAIENFAKTFGEHGTYRVISSEEMEDPEQNPEEGLFSHTDDYIKLVNLSRRFPKINEIDLNSEEHYRGLVEISKVESDIIPLFIKNEDGKLNIINSNSMDVEIDEGSVLVYLGKEFKQEESKEVTKDEEEIDVEIDEEKTD